MAKMRDYKYGNRIYALWNKPTKEVCAIGSSPKALKQYVRNFEEEYATVNEYDFDELWEIHEAVDVGVFMDNEYSCTRKNCFVRQAIPMNDNHLPM